MFILPEHVNRSEKMKQAFILTALLPALLLVVCCASKSPVQLRTDSEYYNKAMGFYNSRNYVDAIPAFEDVREKFPLSPFAVQSILRLGESHYFKRQYDEAVYYFDIFRRLHPSNAFVPYSIYMSGMCYFDRILSADRDQTYAKNALEHFSLLLELFPESPYTGRALCKITQSKRRIAEYELFVGRFYFRQKNYTGAAERFAGILRDYPNALDKDMVIYHLAEAVILSGNTQRGTDLLRLLLRRYPDSTYAPEARAMLDLHSS